MFSKRKTSDATELDEWKAQQQWELAKNGIKEAGSMHDRIKARLFNVLSLSITLSTASGAGAFSGKVYAIPCGAMLGGFALCALCSISGLWSTKTIATDISPDIFDKLLDNTSPPPTNKTAGMRQMANAFYEVSLVNCQIANRDRRWLKTCWILLLASPLVGLALAVFSG